MDGRVGHFRTYYLPLTETFIYQYLTNHERYDPFVCAFLEQNLEKFPFESRHVLQEEIRTNPSLAVDAFGHVAKLGYPYFERVLDREDPDVVHAHFGPMGWHLQHVVEDRPLVTTFYGYDTSELVSPDTTLKERAKRLYTGDYRKKYRTLFAEGDRFLVEGPAMKEKLVNLGCPPRKIGIQRIAIDVDRIKPSYPDSDPDWRVLMVGRFVDKKGMPDGIRAFARAFGDEPDAELRIVGGDAREVKQEDLEAIAGAEGVREKVTFTGYLDYDEYVKEIHSCDLLLAPSRTGKSGDSEGGAPTVLLEAQAAGKPVVATTHADIPYVVEDGVSGKLAPERDVDGLVRKLNEFRSDPGVLAEFGERGRTNMERRHDISVLAPQLESTYDTLL
ncbi:glycosyltransferase [Haloarchaeobius sp. TZWWS8]|uniref:glycosyltransferase n=1 Tax=Haloarchaeobius sp. TZWWS8 TaxID=3446121 RepID=UPI003EBE7179